MKAISIMISAVLIIAITTALVIIILQIGLPIIQQGQDVLVTQEGKNTLITIDRTITQIISEGPNSTRTLPLSISGGSYYTNPEQDYVIFELLPQYQLTESSGRREGNIIIQTEPNLIKYTLDYHESAIDIISELQFGRGSHMLVIKNEGWNQTAGKQMISMKMV